MENKKEKKEKPNRFTYDSDLGLKKIETKKSNNKDGK